MRVMGGVKFGSVIDFAFHLTMPTCLLNVPASTSFVFAGNGGAGSRILAGHQSLRATSTRLVRSDPLLLRIRG